MLLKNIATHMTFLTAVAGAYSRIQHFGHDSHDAMEELTVDMAEEFNLHTDIVADSALFWHSTSRSKKPAMIVCSPLEGQSSSPNAVLVVYGATFMVQVFETGADDGGVEDHCPYIGYGIETQGRLLLC